MSANVKKSPAPVVVLRDNQSPMRRLFLRLLPASFASLVVHAALLFLLFLLCPFTQADDAVESVRDDTTMIADQTEERKPTFDALDFDPSMRDPDADFNFPVDRLTDFSVPGAVNPSEKLGIHGGKDGAPPVSMQAPAGFGPNGTGGPIDSLIGPGNSPSIGVPGGVNEFGMPLFPGSINGRSAGTREFALRNGGSTASEVAVGKGLKWLIRQQLSDGRWMLNGPNLPLKDRGTEVNDVAGTALGLLPFLAAGKTHKPAASNPYDKNIERGLKFLIRSQDKTGYFGNGMYAHGLATIVLCEAYGLTQDPVLRRPAQNAINLIVATQHGANGGWSYGPDKEAAHRDMSISGWQIMALKSGQMAGLTVPTTAIERSKTFLKVTNNPDEGYSYTPGTGSTHRMTAVGLLCRQYMDSWGPSNPQLIKGIRTFVVPNPPDRQDVYYYYYATQVMHHFGGEAWRDWNEKMREFLIRTQESNEKNAQFGSWSPEGDPYARSGGRLMMTSLNLLTLEVYYRYLPLYYRDAGYKMDEAVKKAS
jgi:hypothetical protein